MKPGWLLAYGVLIGLLAGGVLYLISQPRRGAPLQLQPPPTAAPIQVHVAGEVVSPGVVRLPSNSRVSDAIQAAGGLTAEADAGALNLAGRLQDGQKVAVPKRLPTAAAVNEAGSAPQPLVYPIDLNTADQPALESLPGIGPTTAQAILRYRQEHGPFASLDDLDSVPGIGPATLEAIRDLVVVNP